MSIKVIAFDIGGVITPEFSKTFYARVREETGIERDTLRPIIQKYGHALERGTLLDEAFWKHVAHEAGKEDAARALAKLWHEVHRDIHTINPSFSAVYPRLKTKYRIGCLSNTQEPHAGTHREKGTYKYFEPIVLSHEVGVAKPDPDIYLLFARRAQCQPSEVFFLDDREMYVEAAKRAGMQGIVYKYGEDLEKALRDAGVNF